MATQLSTYVQLTYGCSPLQALDGAQLFDDFEKIQLRTHIF